MVDPTLQTYGDVSRKEDVVLNAIEILTAKEDLIQNMLGKTSAIDTIHHYLYDSLAAVATGAVAEVGDYTMRDLTTPSRLTNLVEITALPFAVTRTQQEIEHYHGRDELQRQVEKALMEYANSVEYDLLRSTLVSGQSGVAVKVSGILQAISHASNYSAHNSGTVWNATILDAFMANNYDYSNGDVATDLFMGSFLRKATDGFVAKSNVVVNNGSQTSLVRTVSTYETAFGTLRIHTHRYLNIAGTDATGRILGLRPDKLKIAFLRKPYIDNGLARNGDYDKRAIVGKWTLEVHNKLSNFYYTGMDID